ncbi:MAG: thiamine ABC transporter permease, partial [Clostridiales bacterium]|nr:thiamine ABC transporter permease [Clostridiales bacterium]
MNTKYYQEHNLIRIFLSYFKPHRKLFALDMLCALLVAAVDLAFPLVSRWSMNNLLPDQKYMIFFIVMGSMAVAYLIRALLYYIICY